MAQELTRKCAENARKVNKKPREPAWPLVMRKVMIRNSSSRWVKKIHAQCAVLAKITETNKLVKTALFALLVLAWMLLLNVTLPKVNLMLVLLLKKMVHVTNSSLLLRKPAWPLVTKMAQKLTRKCAENAKKVNKKPREPAWPLVTKKVKMPMLTSVMSAI